jgi:hypothetical protein
VFHPLCGAGTDRLALAALLIWETVGCAKPVAPHKPKTATTAKTLFMVSPHSRLGLFHYPSGS